MCVLLGYKLSLQSHKQSSEHQIILKGIAKVKICNRISILKSGEITYVSFGFKRRLENEC